MVSFGKFARIASLCVGYLGPLYGTLFTKTLAKFEFPARTSNKICLNVSKFEKPQRSGDCLVKVVGVVYFFFHPFLHA